MKTFVRRHGNKSRYLKSLLSHIPSSFGRYVEPFVGSGALFLALQPQRWILNDINQDIINIWTCVSSQTSLVMRRIKDFGKGFMHKSKRERTFLCRNLTSQLEAMPYTCKRATTYMLLTYCAYMGSIVNNNKFYFPGLEINLYDTFPSFLKESFFDNLRTVSSFMNS